MCCLWYRNVLNLPQCKARGYLQRESVESVKSILIQCTSREIWTRGTVRQFWKVGASNLSLEPNRPTHTHSTAREFVPLLSLSSLWPTTLSPPPGGRAGTSEKPMTVLHEKNIKKTAKKQLQKKIQEKFYTPTVCCKRNCLQGRTIKLFFQDDTVGTKTLLFFLTT